jgi:SPP1 gp7 family putative phage head morphogenesis protein
MQCAPWRLARNLRSRVVTTDPTQLNVVALSDDLFAAVQGSEALARQVGTGAFNLTAAKGTMITLPNGRTVEKAFRGIAVDQAERFSQVVRSGLLTGETTPSIAKRLIGRLGRSEERLIFGEVATTTRQLRAAGVKSIIASGGELTAMADNQIISLVRTSINQVANAAAMSIYEANQDITKKYRYSATLDTKTSSICRALDGQEFEYGKGPVPPQHFGCRSAVVAVIDYKGLDFVPPPPGRRASADGPVSVNTSYGQWLKDQPLKTQQDVLGPSKVPYFNRLVEKYGARDAMAKLVRDDGSELTLEQFANDMALPDLRHFRDGGRISSDPVEALVGEAWVPAIYTDKGWATALQMALSCCRASPSGAHHA